MADTLALVAQQGPIRARDTGAVRPAPRPGHMWNWHEGKVALEYLFFSGRVAAARRVNFERYYDLTERVLPPEIHGRPTPAPPTPSASWSGSPPKLWAWPPSPTWGTTSGCPARCPSSVSPSWRRLGS